MASLASQLSSRRLLRAEARQSQSELKLMVLNLMETDERFPPRLRAFLEEYQRSVAAEELPAAAPIAEAAVEEVIAVDIGPGTAPRPLPQEGNDVVAKASHAREALVESLEAHEAIREAGGDVAAAQQLKIMERAEQYALALVDAPGELPAPGAYTDVASIFAALQPKAAGKLAPVKLLRSSWIVTRAAQLRAATTDDERRLLRLPRRQDLERDEPNAFMSSEELEALPRNRQTGSLALGASSYCWLSPQHPDPLGEQLMSLAAAIERAQTKGEHGNPDGQAFPSEAAFFIGTLCISRYDTIPLAVRF